MCGLSAILRFEGTGALDLADLQRMHDAQRHRGPDGEGAFVVSRSFHGGRFERVPRPTEAMPAEVRMAAAVRRLRISDPRPEADQPLVSADRRCVVMLNGAIYNYRELAAELAQAGHSFRTGSDTEVVMQAYRRWGASCFAKFNGMWAILIVDLDRRQVIGSRDRIGIKPLYYSVDGGRLLLASEPWAIAQTLATGARIEPARCFEFLSGYAPRSAALSFFRGVNPVPAGTWFEIDLTDSSAREPRFQTYWSLAEFRADERPVMPFAEAAAQFREAFDSAVAWQSLADVKVGSLLSGGLDSSTIVMRWAQFAKTRGSQRPDTLSIAWDDPAMSERPFIEAIAAAAGADSHILQLSYRDVWQSVDTVVKAQAQPLLGQDLIAQYHAYRLAHDHGDAVVMDGNGLDEVQAGLPNYEAQMVVERLTRLHLLDFTTELRCIARTYGYSASQVLRSYVFSPLRRNFRERRGLPPQSWLDARALDTRDPAWTASFATDKSRDRSHLNRILYRETRHTNIPAVLMYSDRNAMAHSVEARFPYLDHRLIELCFSLPASYKVGFGRRKRLLFETARQCLPRMVAESKVKRRFVLMNNWMPLRGEPAAAIREASRSPALAALPYVKAPKLHKFVDDYLAGQHEDGYAVWRIFTAARWLDLFGL